MKKIIFIGIILFISILILPWKDWVGVENNLHRNRLNKIKTELDSTVSRRIRLNPNYNKLTYKQRLEVKQSVLNELYKEIPELKD
jgi:hypothetical protein